MPRISSSAAPSNTGVANGTPLVRFAGHLADFVVRQVVEALGLAARLVVELVEELAQLGHLGLASAACRRCAGRCPCRPSPGGPRAPGRRSSATARPAGSARCRTACRRPCRACLRPATIFETDALVAVTAGHLVARLQAALDGQVDLDHLQHAGRQLVALRQLLALLFEGEVEAVARLLERVLDRLELVGEVVFRRADVEPVVLLDAGQVGLVDRRCPWRSCSGRRWRGCRSAASRSGRTRRLRRCAAGRSGRGG